MRAKRNLLYIFLLFFLLILIDRNSIAEENYCNDLDSWEEWDELVVKNPNDMDIQTLHALRLGLCFKVERGDLTLQQATDIFESARDVILDKKKSLLPEEGSTL